METEFNLAVGEPPAAGGGVIPIFSPRPDDQLRARAVLDLLTIAEPVPRRLAAHRYFAQLCQPNWALEWNLPRWVGGPLGLESQLQAELVEINALALMALRLQDDLADGDLKAEDPLPPLGTSLLESVRQRTESLLPPEHTFWHEYKRQLNAWQRSQAHGSWHHFEQNNGVDRDLSLPAAPLQLSLQATCYLSGRPAVIQQLTPAIKEYLCAFVLIDHLKDWTNDVDRGRDNRFVQSLFPTEEPRTVAAIKAAVWTAIANDDGFSSYLAEIVSRLNRATIVVGGTRFKRLHHYFSYICTDVQDSAENLQSQAKLVLDKLSGALFFSMNKELTTYKESGNGSGTNGP